MFHSGSVDSKMISVLLTAFNAEKYIQQAIESIVNQTCTDWELIIVDDGSTDKTFVTISQHIDKCPRYTFIAPGKGNNRGHTKSLNVALKKVKGDILLWMDADDISMPNRMKEQLKCIESGADLVTTHGIAINEKGERIKDPYTDNFQRRTELEIKIHLESDAWLMLPSLMWRREVTEKIGLFDEDCVFSQDLNYFVRALNHFRWDKCEMELYKLRRHKGSVRKIDKRAKERNWHQFALDQAKISPIIPFEVTNE